MKRLKGSARLVSSLEKVVTWKLLFKNILRIKIKLGRTILIQIFFPTNLCFLFISFLTKGVHTVTYYVNVYIYRNGFFHMNVNSVINYQVANIQNGKLADV